MNTKLRPTYVENFLRNEYDFQPNSLDYNTYRNNLTDPVNLGRNEKIEYDYQREFFQICSRDRDRTQYPSPTDFAITLPEPQFDIVTLELAAGTIPNRAPLDTDAYTYLDIQSLNYINTTSGGRYFGILALHAGNTGGFFNLDKSSTNQMPLTFQPIKTKLNQLHITLRRPNGDIVNIGNDSTNPSTPVIDSIQTTFTFQIKKRLRKREGLDLDFRNVDPDVDYS
jgi:hypothetical protein